jgi:hypothetical protein
MPWRAAGKRLAGAVTGEELAVPQVDPGAHDPLPVQPQAHFTVSIRCSVTSAFTGGMSMTWRRSVLMP